MTMTDEPTTGLDPIARLSRDVRQSADELVDRAQARFLVDLYYQLQEHRKGLRNQERALTASEEPHLLVAHFANQIETLEKQIIPVMDRFSNNFEVGRWSKAQKGIGPILAAGLLAHIDIERAQTAGAIWRFAGLDPTSTWGKGERRPWNADLKVLCWKIGDSFVKVSGYEDAYYGLLYRQRKIFEVDRDEAGGNAETAATTLETRNIKDPATKRVYESGHLPAGRLDLRARRWAVKLFLAHWHDVSFRDRYGVAPPAPYAIAHLGHAHYMPPPPAS